MRNIAFDLTLDEYLNLIKDGICHYCTEPLNETGSGLDRKNNEPLYSVQTAVPCCRQCNITFNGFYTYEEKLLSAKTIKKINSHRAKRNLNPI